MKKYGIIIAVCTVMAGCGSMYETASSVDCLTWEPEVITTQDSHSEKLAKLERNTEMQAKCDVFSF